MLNELDDTNLYCLLAARTGAAAGRTAPGAAAGDAAKGKYGGDT